MANGNHWLDPNSNVFVLAKAAGENPADQTVHNALADELQGLGDPLHKVISRSPAYNKWYWDQENPIGQGESHDGYLVMKHGSRSFDAGPRYNKFSIHHKVIGPKGKRYSQIAAEIGEADWTSGDFPKRLARFVAPVTKQELKEILDYHKDKEYSWTKRDAAKRAIKSPAVGEHPMTQLARRNEYVEPVSGLLSRIVARAKNFNEGVFSGAYEESQTDPMYSTPEVNGTQLKIHKYQTNTHDIQHTFPVVHVLASHKSGGTAVYHSAPVTPQEALELVYHHSGPAEAKKFLGVWKNRSPVLKKKLHTISNRIETPENPDVKKLSRHLASGTTNHALLEGIASNPKDDTARNAISDKMEEEGDPLHIVFRRHGAFRDIHGKGTLPYSANYDLASDVHDYPEAAYRVRSTLYQTPEIDKGGIRNAKKPFPVVEVRRIGPGTQHMVIARAPVTKSELNKIRKFHQMKSTWEGNTKNLVGAYRNSEEHEQTKLARQEVPLTNVIQELLSKNQKVRRYLAQQVMQQAGLKLTNLLDTASASPQPRASLVQEINSGDPEGTKYAAAWYGLLAKEPQLTVFHEDENGPDVLHTWKSPIHAGDILNLAASLGIPGVSASLNGNVHVHNPGGAGNEKIQEFAEATKAQGVETIRGFGTKLGSATGKSDAARESYRNTIQKYEQQGQPTRLHRISSTALDLIESNAPPEITADAFADVGDPLETVARRATGRNLTFYNLGLPIHESDPTLPGYFTIHRGFHGNEIMPMARIRKGDHSLIAPITKKEMMGILKFHYGDEGTQKFRAAMKYHKKLESVNTRPRPLSDPPQEML